MAPIPAGTTNFSRQAGARTASMFDVLPCRDLLLTDEKLGVRLARRRGLKVIGTLGVLVQAANHRLVDINVAVERLQTTDFRCTPQLFEQTKLSRHASDRSASSPSGNEPCRPSWTAGTRTISRAGSRKASGRGNHRNGRRNPRRSSVKSAGSPARPRRSSRQAKRF